jgi:WD40 repeat protein/serine/threonine protein kinase
LTEVPIDMPPADPTPPVGPGSIRFDAPSASSIPPASPPPGTEPTGESAVPLTAGSEPVPGYKLVRILGRGGFGEVWQAEAPGGFPVAVKFVPLAGRLGEEELRSLPVLRRLRHPNVLTTFGSWQAGGRLVIAMELADRTLTDRLREVRDQGKGGIPAAELLGYLRGAARGLDYLNHPRPPAPGEPPQGIQHRDVKPQNLLLVGDQVKVSDFGLARVLHATVAHHSGGFTPAYAAPEFFHGESARQSDQYSLAVAYCELRGGRLPFAGTVGEIVIGHVQHPPDLGMLPPAERPAVARALAKKPADRWPSCGVFVDAVAAAVTTAVTTAPKRPFGRTPAVVAGLATVAAAIGVGVFLSGHPPAATTAPIPPDTAPTGKPPVEPGPVSPPVPGTEPPRPSEPVTPATPVGERGRFTRHAAAVRCVAWVPKAGRVLSGGDGGELWLWDARTGDGRKLAGHADTVHAVAVSADGKRALSASDDKTVRLWDLDEGTLLQTLRKRVKTADDSEFELYGVAFDGVGRAVSAGNANLVVRWDLTTAAEAGRVVVGLDEVLGFARSPDGAHLLLGGKGGRVVVRGEADAATETAYTGHRDDVLAVAWFPDGERFVTAGGGDGKGDGANDHTVRVWTRGRADAAVFSGHDDRVTGVSVSADGRRLLSGDRGGRLRLWDANTGRELPRFDAAPAPSGVNAVAISPDGAEAVSAHRDGTVRVWRLPR